VAHKHAVHRIPPPRTLALDSIADLRAFRQSVNKRLKFPRLRVALRIPGLRSTRGERYERLINRQLGRSGGWPALWTAVTFTGLAMYFPIEPAGVESIPALAAWVAEVALGWVSGWLAGKGGALVLAHWRIWRLCKQVETEAAAGAGKR
jgi:hypothetical protein